MITDETVENIGRSETRNSLAREAALRAVSRVSIEPTSLVSYRSAGRMLIIGDTNGALAVGARFKNTPLRCFVLARGEGLSRADGEVPLLFISPRLELRVKGHLGEFTVSLWSEVNGEIDLGQAFETGDSHFDLILDLGVPPLLNWDLPPVGYYAPGADQAELARVLAELPEMVGEFDKAKFFHYDPDICAHGNSGLQGCRRCLDTCPTGAITSLRDIIAVDPYLCQGAGSCATACPTGAIVYGFPKPGDTLNRLRVLLRSYAEAGGSEPMLLFHDAAGKCRLASEPLPGNMIPIEVEEIGSIGMEIWLAALAYGATWVGILNTPQSPPSVLREIHQQMGFAHALLEVMGYPPTVLRLIDCEQGDIGLRDMTADPGMPPIKPACFAASNAKRDTLYLAIDFLAAQSLPSASVLALPPQAPFGEVRVDRQACTLCMACVSVCPASALFDGEDRPRLGFIEANCVQCGLCELACPEDAITLHPRFVFDPQQRRRRRLLNEEEAFYCIACGKPFASRRMIEKMAAKLSDHWMFQDGAALKRLQMCGDCRVRDMFSDQGRVPK